MKEFLLFVPTKVYANPCTYENGVANCGKKYTPNSDLALDVNTIIIYTAVLSAVVISGLIIFFYLKNK